MIKEIIEDNALKCGKYLPDEEIKIISKKEATTKKIDCLIVLAWNYFEDIKKNNQELCKNIFSIKDLEK